MVHEAAMIHEAAMVHEAAVFRQADRAAVEVFRSIRAEQWDTELAPVFDMPGADQPQQLRKAINHYACDNSWVPDMLAGRTMSEVGVDRFDGDLLGDDPAEAIRRISTAATKAVGRVRDPELVVHCSYGDCGVADYFWQLNIARSLLAHDVAVHIGSPDQLTEELSRAMFEGTAPLAELWRSYGIYRAEVPVPPGASWRVKFLGLTGRTSDQRSRCPEPVGSGSRMNPSPGGISSSA